MSRRNVPRGELWKERNLPLGDGIRPRQGADATRRFRKPASTAARLDRLLRGSEAKSPSEI